MSRTTYKLTINGGTRIGVYRDMERLQAAMLPMVGRLDLFVRETSDPKWVLHITPSHAGYITQHGTIQDPEFVWTPDWMAHLQQALGRAPSAKDPAHD